jgi:hypothetical protein
LSQITCSNHRLLLVVLVSAVVYDVGVSVYVALLLLLLLLHHNNMLPLVQVPALVPVVVDYTRTALQARILV